MLVHSFLNGASAFTHTRAGLPPAPTGADAQRHAATRLRWLDEPPRTKPAGGAKDRGGKEASPPTRESRGEVDASLAAESWELTGSKPILGVSEATEFIEDSIPSTSRSL